VRPRVVSHLNATIHSLFSKSPNLVQRDSDAARHRGDPPGHWPAFGELGLLLRGLEPPTPCAR
jgi:hypothetical protein